MKIALLLERLLEQKNLKEMEAAFLLDSILEEEVNPSQVAAILTALKIKGETTEEMLGFIKSMRTHMKKVEVSGEIIDTCGTGGDGHQTFNISTATALVVASCGVQVAKHGNKAASSLCGSADVFEKLGVNINLTPVQAERILHKVGMVFLYAPLFHAGLKPLVQVRKELGFRTVFNYLGPFCNPTGLQRQVIGVPSLDIAKKLADVAKHLRYEHVMIVANKEGLDEISLSVPTTVFEVRGETVRKYTIHPSKLGIKPASLDALKGADATQNASIIHDILNGKHNAKRDIVLLNAAYALLVAGAVQKPEEGMILAAESIDKGDTKKLLQTLIMETQRYAA